MVNTKSLTINPILKLHNSNYTYAWHTHTYKHIHLQACKVLSHTSVCCVPVDLMPFIQPQRWSARELLATPNLSLTSIKSTSSSFAGSEIYKEL